jgi:two-component sensor histidine kinase
MEVNRAPLREIAKAIDGGKMHPRQSAESDLDEKGLALLLGELDHRIRNLLMMIEAAVRQTHSTSVDDYRAKLIARNTGLHDFYQFTTSYGRTLGLRNCLNRPLALALHLVLHELAANAKKYGALSSPLGHVKIGWTIRHLPGAPRKLAIAWSEHGGPEVQRPQHHGFCSRLIKRELDGYGGVRMDFNSAGLACFMLIDLDHSDARIQEPAGETRRYRSKPDSHSTR